jgi:hypothetical protein
LRLLGLALIASALAVSTPAAVAVEPLSAADVLSRLASDTNSQQRDAWYNANAKGKAVVWVAPVFNVMTFGLVIVSMRAADNGLVACQVPKRLEAAGKKVSKGEAVLCAGRIDNYERMGGAALVNVVADDFVIGQEKIDAWQKAQKRSP